MKLDMMSTMLYSGAMSNILDTINGMAHEEKSTWLNLAIATAVFVAYLRTILARAQFAPLVEVAYVGPMLWSIGIGVVGAIAAAILLAVAWPKEAEKTDQRDREVGRFGEFGGRAFIVVGAVTALVLAMAEARHFWIAQALFLGFYLSSLLEGAAKIVAYRRGVPTW